ncbi:MAG TPA: exodeoxyribonuclease VII large subunit [Steroidobacteraceae bacterium]|nr:exodeoxyribonuclease VII large subunit [Steroidobacteraceae bacterium]
MATAASESERDIYTPSRLNREARALLERGLPALWLQGEISNFSRPTSGHWYFSLKDEGAQLRCAMFRQRNLLAQFSPKDGTHVLARGRVSLYEPRGDYQFIVDYLEEAGEGALRRRFELLKAKLAAAGLFASERKRPLPKIPKQIGVITSPTGAAIRDILHVLRRRFPLANVRIYPVPVQGAQAAEQIAAAIALASARADCDVLILARGGGSLEDLWAFNEEIVARALFECRVPTIAGIGHETDFTIADFVVDVRAPTPSGAAEIAVPDAREWLQRFARTEERIVNALGRRLVELRDHSVWLQRRLQQLHPGIALRQRAQRLDELEQRLRRSLLHRFAQLRALLVEHASQLRRHSPALRLARTRSRIDRASLQLKSTMMKRIETTRTRYALATRSLDAMSPLATLQRGYAIVTDEHGTVVNDARRISVGAQIDARLARGRVAARVESREIDSK